MAKAFDPYHRWLGIRPDERPISHYRLLGLSPDEADPDVIQSVADARMAHVRTYQSGPQSADSQRILNEISVAKLCLLDPAKKAAYDASLVAAANPPPVADIFDAGLLDAAPLPPGHLHVPAAPEPTDMWGAPTVPVVQPVSYSEPRQLVTAEFVDAPLAPTVSDASGFDAPGFDWKATLSQVVAARWFLPAAVGGAAACLALFAVIGAVVFSGTPASVPSILTPAPTSPVAASFPASGYDTLLAKRAGPLSQWKHPNVTSGVAISPGGTEVATTSADGRVRVLNLIDGKERGMDGFHAAMSWSIAWHPNGRHLLSSGFDGTFRMWDSVACKEERRLRQPGRICKLSVSLDGRHALVPGSDGVRYWNLTRTDEPVATFKTAEPMIAAGLSPDGRYGVAGGPAGKLYVWNLGNQTLEFEKPAHNAQIDCISYAPNGERFATVGYDGQILLWNAKFEITHQFRLSAPVLKAVAISGDNKRLAVGGVDGQVHVIDLDTMVPVVALQGNVNGVEGVSLSHDGRLVASGGMDSIAHVWRVPDPGTYPVHPTLPYVTPGKDGPKAAPPQPFVPKAVAPQPVARLPETPLPVGTQPKTGPQPTGTLRVPQGKPLEIARPSDVRFEHAHDASITNYAVGTRGRLVTTTSSGGPVTWDVASGRVLHTGPKFRGDSAVSSADGRRLVTNLGGTIAFWNFDTGVIEREVRLPASALAGNVQQMTLSADGGTAVVANGGRSIVLVDASAGSARVLELASFCSQAMFSRDGGQILAVTAERIERFSYPDGKRLPPIESSVERYTLAAIDGAVIGVSSADPRHILWLSLTDGKHFKGALLPARVRHLRLTPDGGGALLVTDDGWIRLWHFGEHREAVRIKAPAFRAAVTPEGYVIGGNSSLSAWRLPDAVWDRSQPGARIDDLPTAQDLPQLVAAFRQPASKEQAPVPARKQPARAIPQLPVSGGLRALPAEPAERIELRKADIVFQGPFQHSITSHALGTQGRLLTCTTTAGPVLWDVGTGRPLPSPKYTGKSPASSPDGRRLATHEGNAVGFWDFDTGKLERQVPFPQGFDPSWVQISFSPDGKRAALAGGGKDAALVDATSGESFFLPVSDFCSQAEFSLDGRQFLAVTQQRIERFSVPDCKPLPPINVQVERYTFFPFDRTQAVGVSSADKRKLLFVDLAEKKTLREAELPAEIYFVSLTPDRRGAVLGVRDGSLRVWRLDTNREVARIEHGTVFGITVTPDGYVVAGNTGLSAWRLPDTVWDRPAGSEWISKAAEKSPE